MTPGISQDNTLRAPRATGGWLAHTWRLVRWNLKLARRRLMSKILLGILLAGLVLVITFLLLAFAAINSISASDLSSDCPSPVATAQPVGTVTVLAPNGCDPTSIQQEQDSLQSTKNDYLQLVSFPTILAPVGGYTGFMGIILLCILAGAVIGGEYSFGTQRLALSRGVSRAQLLAGQVGALAILALAVAGFMLILGALLGFALGPGLGATIPAISAGGIAQLLGFWLALSLRLFAYTLVALLLATLSSSTAAGIAGSLGYMIFEIIALPVISAIALLATGSTFSAILNHIQDFFLGPNLSALLNGVSQAPLDLGGSSSALDQNPISPLQGLIVALLYCVGLVGISYWVLRKRDVTH